MADNSVGAALKETGSLFTKTSKVIRNDEKAIKEALETNQYGKLLKFGVDNALTGAGNVKNAVIGVVGAPFALAYLDRKVRAVNTYNRFVKTQLNLDTVKHLNPEIRGYPIAIAGIGVPFFEGIDEYTVNIDLSNYYTLDNQGKPVLTAEGDALMYSLNSTNYKQKINDVAAQIRLSAVMALQKSIKAELESATAANNEDEIKRLQTKLNSVGTFITNLNDPAKYLGLTKDRIVDTRLSGPDTRLNDLLEIIKAKLESVYKQTQQHDIYNFKDVDEFYNKKLSKAEKEQINLLKVNAAKAEVAINASNDGVNLNLPAENRQNLVKPLNGAQVRIDQPLQLNNLKFPRNMTLDVARQQLGIAQVDGKWTYNSTVNKPSKFLQEFWEINKQNIMSELVKGKAEYNYLEDKQYGKHLEFYVKMQIYNQILKILGPNDILNKVTIDASVVKTGKTKPEDLMFNLLGDQAKAMTELSAGIKDFKDKSKIKIIDFATLVNEQKEISILVKAFTSKEVFAGVNINSATIITEKDTVFKAIQQLATSLNKITQAAENLKPAQVPDLNTKVNELVEDYKQLTKYLIAVFLTKSTANSDNIAESEKIKMETPAGIKEIDTFYKAMFNSNNHLREEIGNILMLGRREDLNVKEYEMVIKTMRKLGIDQTAGNKIINALADVPEDKNDWLPAQIFALKKNTKQQNAYDYNNNFSSTVGLKGLLIVFTSLFKQGSENYNLLKAMFNTLLNDLKDSKAPKNNELVSTPEKIRLLEKGFMDFVSLLELQSIDTLTFDQAEAYLQNPIYNLIIESQNFLGLINASEKFNKLKEHIHKLVIDEYNLVIGEQEANETVDLQNLNYRQIETTLNQATQAIQDANSNLTSITTEADLESESMHLDELVNKISQKTIEDYKPRYNLLKQKVDLYNNSPLFVSNKIQNPTLDNLQIKLNSIIAAQKNYLDKAKLARFRIQYNHLVGTPDDDSNMDTFYGLQKKVEAFDDTKDKLLEILNDPNYYGTNGSFKMDKLQAFKAAVGLVLTPDQINLIKDLGKKFDLWQKDYSKLYAKIINKRQEEIISDEQLESLKSVFKAEIPDSLANVLVRIVNLYSSPEQVSVTTDQQSEPQSASQSTPQPTSQSIAPQLSLPGGDQEN